MTFLLSILGYGRIAAQAVASWLSRRSLAELAALALAIVCLVEFVALKAEQRHANKLEAQISKLEQQNKALQSKIDQADAAARKAEAEGKRIAKQLKDRTDEENRRIAGDAGTLKLSGPGKAVCRPAPAAASGHEQAASEPNAPGPALPPADGADVSWGWLVTRGQEHDQLIAEDKAWRDWYAALLKIWPKTTEAGR